MSFVCGLVGLPGVGKTTIFNAITAAGAEGFGGDEANRATVSVPDNRIAPLAALYNTAKTIPAQMEVVDIPGLKAGSTAGGGRGSRLLAHIKDVDAVIQVVRCFGDPAVSPESGTPDPVRDVETIDLEMVAADVQTVQNKIERLSKKAKSGEAEARRDLASLEKIAEGLNSGRPARKLYLDERDRAAVFDCNLVSLKPVLYVGNLKSVSDSANPRVAALERLAKSEQAEMVLVVGRDEAEIARLDPGDRRVFLAELGLNESSMERLIRAAYKTIGLVNFITAGPKEVHVWTCKAGSLAPRAAGKIHSDMEKGFIRMEVMTADDLLRLGSEAAVAKSGKKRIEGKDYVVKDGDIVVVRFNK
ncbi:MAG: redox-regulated ATPase YchF [Planctomycetota bacterium]|jgi:GTP-binding protein YchF|nr:redox-regulated ATPase YchF [Planctomycetota bacterium]